MKANLSKQLKVLLILVGAGTLVVFLLSWTANVNLRFKTIYLPYPGFNPISHCSRYWKQGLSEVQQAHHQCLKDVRNRMGNFNSWFTSLDEAKCDVTKFYYKQMPVQTVETCERHEMNPKFPTGTKVKFKEASDLSDCEGEVVAPEFRLTQGSPLYYRISMNCKDKNYECAFNSLYQCALISEEYLTVN